MTFARFLLKGNPVERARLRRHPSEKLFGVQIATNQIQEGVNAGRMAADAGADFLDLNCGCPIHETWKRGLGAALLKKPAGPYTPPLFQLNISTLCGMASVCQYQKQLG
jgi:tRNA-dihydrouridine synthase 3